MTNENAQTSPAQRFPDLDSAIQTERASYSQYLLTHFGQHEWHTPEAERRDAYKWYEPHILKAFQNAHGNVDELFICKNIAAAALLTSQDDFYLQYDFGQFPAADQLLGQAHRIASDATQFLEGKDLRTCLEMLFDTTTAVLALMDQAARSEPGRDRSHAIKGDLLGELRKELDDASRFYIRSTQRPAQLNYFLGMNLGVLLVVGLMLAVVWSFSELESNFDVGPLLGSLGSGAVGAWISVTSRMASWSLSLDHQAGNKHLRILGLFRPVVGAVFATAIYFLISSEVLPITVDTSGRQELFFFIAVGFLAGFQERWAQDMLSVGQDRLKKASTN